MAYTKPNDICFPVKFYDNATDSYLEVVFPEFILDDSLLDECIALSMQFDVPLRQLESWLESSVTFWLNQSKSHDDDLEQDAFDAYETALGNYKRFCHYLIEMGI